MSIIIGYLWYSLYLQSNKLVHQLAENACNEATDEQDDRSFGNACLYKDESSYYCFQLHPHLHINMCNDPHVT